MQVNVGMRQPDLRDFVAFYPLSYFYSRRIARMLGYEKNVSKFQIT